MFKVSEKRQYYTDYNTVYYFCEKRNGWIPCRRYYMEMNKKEFLIENDNLTLEQISNFDYYKQIRDKYIPYEEWKIDPDFPGYEFSSLGRFKLKNGMISIISPNLAGYIKTALKDSNNKQHPVAIHRIIAKLFVFNDDIDNKLVVDHLNGIRHDNRSINLLWKTYSENATNVIFANKTNSNKRPIIQYDKEYNKIKVWESGVEIIKFYGANSVYKYLDGKTLLYDCYWYREDDVMMEGEIFKDFYFEGSNTPMKISNKGRYITINKKISDGSLNDFGYREFHFDGNKYQAHRLIMMTFKPIDKPESYVVDHIDEDKSNNELENLRWATYAQNIQYAAVNRDNKSTYEHSTTSRIIIFKNVINGMEYEFKSIVEGIEKSGFTSGQINAFLAGTYINNLKNNYGEFTVRYKDEIKKSTIFSHYNKVRVEQYDLNGNYLKTFDSIKDALIAVGKRKNSNIIKCCKGNGHTAHGFIWRYEDKTHNDISVISEIVKLDINGNYLETYPSIAEAGRKTKIDSSSICATCKGKSKSAGNFLWMYKDDYERMINDRITCVPGEI